MGRLEQVKDIVLHVLLLVNCLVLYLWEDWSRSRIALHVLLLVNCLVLYLWEDWSRSRI